MSDEKSLGRHSQMRGDGTIAGREDIELKFAEV